MNDVADNPEADQLRKSADYASYKKLLSDREWRLDNLYRIIDEKGEEVQFRRNEAQTAYYRNRWYRDIIAKARQLGFSTLIDLVILDTCVFRSNTSAAIIDATVKDAENKLEKVQYAYAKLPDEVKAANPTVKSNTEEIVWANGSRLEVGTGFRGGTLQMLHISELGKVAVDKPDAARDIRNSSFPAVHQGSWLVVESTAHGTGGEFHTLVTRAQAQQQEGRPLSFLDFRPHFYGWWIKSEYQIPNNLVVLTVEDFEYFDEVGPKLWAQFRVKLNANQMAWYAAKRRELGPDDMREEFPTLPEELFFNSVHGAYWKPEIIKARKEGRIGGLVPYDPTRLVDTAWDIGEDCTAIWFGQTDGVRYRWIDYWEKEGSSLQEACGVLDDKARERKFRYGKHIGPHDMAHRVWSKGAETRYKTAADLGVTFEVIDVVADKADSIEAGRRLLGLSWFDQQHCAVGVSRLENYKKKWNKTLQLFSPDPVHDMASHGSDAFQQYAMHRQPDRPEGTARRRRGGDDRPRSAWAA